MNLIRRVNLTIEGYDMIRPGETILVGVSGGGDSVTLLAMLRDLNEIEDFGWNIHVAHYNHGLRGRDSDEDQEHVRALADRFGYPFHHGKGDVRRKKNAEKLSLEEAARKARHEWLIATAKNIGARKIALAHNLDDQAETILHRIIRGTGIRGLKGMSPIRQLSRKHDLFIVRPLIEIERYEIDAFLRERDIQFRTDMSNFDTSFTRNRLRHRLIPTVEHEYNPRFKQALVKLGQTSASFYFLLREIAGEVYENTRLLGGKDEICFSVEEYAKLPPAIQTLLIDRAVQHLTGQPAVLNFEHYVDILSLCSETSLSKVIRLPHNLEARRDSYILKILIARETPPPVRFRKKKLKVPGKTDLPKLELQIEAILKEGRIVGLKDYIHNKDYMEEIIDADRIKGTLEVRQRKDGDVFSPLGTHGSCKLKKFFIDHKVPQPLRDRIPIVCDGRGIVWVVGYRIGNGYRVTERTRRILHLKVGKSGKK